MLLRSIKLKDFRCFKGDVFIDLKSSAERNVIVLLGDNTFGKSTIVQAFTWCFFGKANFDNPEIFNRGIAKKLNIGEKTTAVVEVEFEHELLDSFDGAESNRTTIYTARRAEEYIKSSDGKMRELSNYFMLAYRDPMTGEYKKCGKERHELVRSMNSIIHSDLAPYFFFAGEKDNELTTKSLGNAVRTLMGLEALVKMREHIRGNTRDVAVNSVIGYYDRKTTDTDNVEIQKQLRIIDDADRNISSYSKRLEELEKDINEYNKKIDDMTQKLREAEPTKVLQELRDTIAADIKKEQAYLLKQYKAYINEFNKNAEDLYTIPLINAAKDKLDKMNLSDKGIKGIEVIAIEELLARGKCLCGTDLREGTWGYNEVAKYKDILPPKSVGVLVRQLMDDLDESQRKGKEFIESSVSIYKDIQVSIDTLHDLERKEQEKIAELKTIGDVPVAQYEDLQSTYKRRIQNCQNEYMSLGSKLRAEESKRETANNNYNELKEKVKKNDEYLMYLAYANEIYDWITRTYDKREKQVREDLEEAVTNLFNNIYTGNREVKIDAHYNISINPKADTGGIKVIQYFSYVGGLVQLASKAMEERKENSLALGSKYPLVLDAAFSHTDRAHTKAIAVELSKVTDQLIFAVMDKDWAHVSDDIQEKVMRTYEFKKLNEDEVCIEEV